MIIFLKRWQSLHADWRKILDRGCADAFGFFSDESQVIGVDVLAHALLVVCISTNQEIALFKKSFGIDAPHALWSSLALS